MQNENVSCYFATGLGISCLHKFCISLMKPPNSSEIPGKIRPCLNFSFKSYGFLCNSFIVFCVSFLYFAFPRSHWFHYSLCGGSTKVCFAPVLPFDDDGRLLQIYNQTASRYFDILVFLYFVFDDDGSLLYTSNQPMGKTFFVLLYFIFCIIKPTSNQ